MRDHQADLRSAVDALANQLCVAVDGNFDFAVRGPIEDETIEKLSMLVNFVLDTARRGMTALSDHNAALAEIDRAKTTFFSNVSHELRTPLALILGPLEDVLDGRLGPITPELHERFTMAQRNAQRLLKLVNTLLEFSRIEAGRLRAAFEPVELAQETSEIASMFRAAVERAGLRYTIDCEPLPEQFYVDRSMWEMIVSNLISNALKFTFDGEIAVTLRWRRDQAVLGIRDTGIGIAQGDLPKIFLRFHRIDGARSRSHEGTGIGLALVQELIKLHGGTITVESILGRGTAFEVRLRPGRAHLPEQHLRESPAGVPARTASSLYVDEAMQWLAAEAAPAVVASGARIVVAEDNADMRTYLMRLLGDRWRVEVTADGVEALDRIRREPPDLVLTDVMMPNLDGFGLLRALRDDPATQNIPIIMLSARAGEEARVEGAAAGADDYVVKPFTARELLARIGAQLSLASTRRDLLEREREARAESERRRTQAEIESRFNAAMYRVAMSLVRETDVEAVMQLVTDEATQLIDAQFGAFFFNARRPDGEAYMLHTLSGAQKDRFANFPLPRVTPLFGPTFRGERIVRLDDVRLDPAYGAWGTQPPGHVVVASYLAVPVVGRNSEVFGGLFFGHNKPAQFTAEHERIVEAIATQGAVALEKARLYQELRDSERRAREADRRKDEFLAMLGHELRNPLAPMLTAIQLLGTHERESREVQVLERQTRHMVRLVDDLLDMSRITGGKLQLDIERLDLAVAVAKAIEMTNPMFEQRRHVIVVDVERGMWVDGDAARLVQIVANLLTNAAKYTPDQGHIEVLGRRDGTRAMLEVKDDGQGINAALLPHVFDLFVQDLQASDRSVGGLGVGLTIVRTLVQRHGGSVEAFSEGEGRGSRFVVRLPLVDAPTTVSVREQPVVPRDRGEHRVLLVDDNEDAAELLAEALRFYGHEVVTALDGPQALVIAREFRATVALLDIGLPVMDGYELAQNLRQLWNDKTPLIALTGYGLDIDRARTQAAGFRHHLTKPIDLEQLHALLKQLVQ